MSVLLAYWVHDLSPFAIQFSDTFGIRYYGLAYIAGFAAAWWLLRRYSAKGLTSLTTDQLGDLITCLVIGVLLGGRLGYFAFYEPEVLFGSPLTLLRVWDGGMASHGGFIGVAAALWWTARATRMPWRHLADLIASVTGAGLLFGRIANFINGELWGKSSTVSWAVIFPLSAPPGTPTELLIARHPSQLYAAALEGLVLLIVMQVLVWKTSLLSQKPGRIAGWFLVGYALMRTISEVFREPDAELILGLSRGTFYSFFIAIAGLALLLAPTGAVTARVAVKPEIRNRNR
jgi:phosphatidylglycerol:prolipoprotein diacylglycerol transferase